MDSPTVLLAGDVHGDLVWALRVARTARALDAVPLVLGDFGYWVHRADGRHFVAALDEELAATDSVLVFVDGNHEYHSTHPAKPPHHRLGLTELPRDGDGFVRVTPHIWFAPRGHRWSMGGRCVAALGGAVSMDRYTRKLYRSWWPEEALSRGAVDRLGSDGVYAYSTRARPFSGFRS